MTDFLPHVREPSSGEPDVCVHCREEWVDLLTLYERDECSVRLRAEVERLRYLLKMSTRIIPRDVAEATVFSQGGDLYAHKFRHKYADEAACGYRPRGPYQPLREEDLSCPDCIDVIQAIGLAEFTPRESAIPASKPTERGEHRREEDKS